MRTYVEVPDPGCGQKEWDHHTKIKDLLSESEGPFKGFQMELAGAAGEGATYSRKIGRPEKVPRPVSITLSQALIRRNCK